MKKIVTKVNLISRQHLANPHNEMTHKEKLIKSKAIDFKENHCIEVLNNGYWIIKPINAEKKY